MGWANLPPSFPRRREGEFTFQVQHLVVEDLGGGPVAEALAGRIVVQLQGRRKRCLREGGEVGGAGQRAPQAADGVLHASLLPGGMGIAEEGLNAQGMEAVVAGELSAIVEGEGLAPRRGKGTQQAFQGSSGGVGSLALLADRQQEAGGALVEGQDHGPRPPEAHQVRLPVAKGLPRRHRHRPLVDRDAVGDEAGGAAAPPSPPAPFGLVLGQTAAPPVVLDPGLLAVDEPVDALVAEHPAPRLPGQPLRDLLGRPPPGKPRQHAFPQRRVPFQPCSPPPPAAGRHVGVLRRIAARGLAVALQFPSHRRWRAIQSCSNLPLRRTCGL